MATRNLWGAEDGVQYGVFQQIGATFGRASDGFPIHLINGQGGLWSAKVSPVGAGNGYLRFGGVKPNGSEQNFGNIAGTLAGPLFNRFYVNFAAFPTVTEPFASLYSTDGAVTLLAVCVDAAGTVSVWNMLTVTQIGTLSTTLHLNTWYRIDFRATVKSASGSVDVWINSQNHQAGDDHFSGTGLAFTGKGIDSLLLGKHFDLNGGASGYTAYFDDLHMDDANYPTEGVVVNKLPAGNGTFVGFNTLAPLGGNKFDKINEVPPNEGGTTIETSTFNESYSATVTPNSSAGTSGILGTTPRVVKYVNRVFVGSGGSVNTFIYDPSTTLKTSLAADDTIVAYTNVGLIAANDPNTSPWSIPVLDRVEIGMTADAAVVTRVTAAYLMVEVDPTNGTITTTTTSTTSTSTTTTTTTTSTTSTSTTTTFTGTTTTVTTTTTTSTSTSSTSSTTSTVLTTPPSSYLLNRVNPLAIVYVPYAQASDFKFPLQGSTDHVTFVTNPTLASGDVTATLDNGVFTNLETLCGQTFPNTVDVFPGGSTSVRLRIPASALTGQSLRVKFHDVAGAQWDDCELIFETYGSLLAKHPGWSALSDASVQADVDSRLVAYRLNEVASQASQPSAPGSFVNRISSNILAIQDANQGLDYNPTTDSLHVQQANLLDEAGFVADVKTSVRDADPTGGVAGGVGDLLVRPPIKRGNPKPFYFKLINASTGLLAPGVALSLLSCLVCKDGGAFVPATGGTFFEVGSGYYTFTPSVVDFTVDSGLYLPLASGFVAEAVAAYTQA